MDMGSVGRGGFSLFLSRMVGFSMLCMLAGGFFLLLVFIDVLSEWLYKRFGDPCLGLHPAMDALDAYIRRILFWAGLVLFFFGAGVLALMYAVACPAGHSLG